MAYLLPSFFFFFVTFQNWKFDSNPHFLERLARCGKVWKSAELQAHSLCWQRGRCCTFTKMRREVTETQIKLWTAAATNYSFSPQKVVLNTYQKDATAGVLSVNVIFHVAQLAFWSCVSLTTFTCALIFNTFSLPRASPTPSSVSFAREGCFCQDRNSKNVAVWLRLGKNNQGKSCFL